MTNVRPGEVPNPEALRTAFEELLRLYDGQVHVRVGRQKARRLFLIHGLIGHAVAQCRAAYLLLADAKTAACAEVNARVAFEHAVMAQYVHLSRDGLEEFDRLLRFRDYRFQKAVQRLPNFTFPDDVELIEAAGKPPIANFYWLCQRFDDSGWLYLPYRVLCNSTHPSDATLDRYIDKDEQDVPTLRMEARIEDGRSTLWAITFSMLMAVAVLEDIRRFKPNKAAVHRIARSIQAPALLTLIE